jgi:ketosteroid isomerase-like protein
VPPGPIATGKESIEKTWRAVLDAGRTGLKYKIQQIKAEGDFVWSVGQFTIMSPDEKGTLQERQGNFAHMYQWQGNELKLRVHAFTFLPSPPAR